MKIQDRTGRTMLVDLVYNHPRLGWLKASTTRLYTTVGAKSVRGTIHARLPYGRFGIRICSDPNGAGVDAILFDNAEKRLQTSVGPRTQIIEFDDQHNALEFRAPGDTTRTQATDVMVQAEPEQAQLALPNATADGDEPQALFVGPHAPAGHGLVYVVVRFAKSNSPYGEPPQEEFELAFQLRNEEDFDEFFAQNLHLVEQAEDLPNKLDPMSLTAPTAEQLAHRPSIHCAFSGCKH